MAKKYNTKGIGDYFENVAKDILSKEGYNVHTDKVHSSESFDIVADKNGKEYYIEVKGRKNGNTKIFSISEIKIERLIELDKDTLFLFINNEGYTLCSLEDVLENKPIMINNKKIIIYFNKSMRINDYSTRKGKKFKITNIYFDDKEDEKIERLKIKFKIKSKEDVIKRLLKQFPEQVDNFNLETEMPFEDLI